MRIGAWHHRPETALEPRLGEVEALEENGLLQMEKRFVGLDVHRKYATGAAVDSQQQVVLTVARCARALTGDTRAPLPRVAAKGWWQRVWRAKTWTRPPSNEGATQNGRAAKVPSSPRISGGAQSTRQPQPSRRWRDA